MRPLREHHAAFDDHNELVDFAVGVARLFAGADAGDRSSEASDEEPADRGYWDFVLGVATLLVQVRRLLERASLAAGHDPPSPSPSPWREILR